MFGSSCDKSVISPPLLTDANLLLDNHFTSNTSFCTRIPIQAQFSGFPTDSQRTRRLTNRALPPLAHPVRRVNGVSVCKHFSCFQFNLPNRIGTQLETAKYLTWLVFLDGTDIKQLRHNSWGVRS